MKAKITFLLLVALLVFGCSRQSAGTRYSPYYSEDAEYSILQRAVSESAYGVMGFNDSGLSMSASRGRVMSNLYDEMIVEENLSTEAANVPASEQRKLVKSAELRIRVENLEAADDSVADLLRVYNAYAASSSFSENSRYYSLRVPAPQYEVFLAEMNGMGRLINRSENTEDVTLRYYDLEGRLESRRGLLRTFQSYLGRANNMEEILSVEARIADLQREIDNTGTQLRNLANRVDYATIDLYLMGPVTVTSIKSETFIERIARLFNSFGGFLTTVVVVLFSVIIYGIPVLLILALLFWVLFGRIGLMKKLWRVVMGKKKN